MAVFAIYEEFLVAFLHIEGEVIDQKSDPVGKEDEDNPEDFLYDREERILQYGGDAEVDGDDCDDKSDLG